jgi:O-acetyl-ADP-ribose deacetylase
VIHTVGPVWNNGKTQEEQKLAECYANSLRLAVDNGCTSIAFPNISTGIYRFPKPLAAKIAVSSVKHFVSENPEIEKVVFVCFDAENFELVTKEVGES